jgi:flagellar biosynthesis/type III secretory pathway protein FliH
MEFQVWYEQNCPAVNYSSCRGIYNQLKKIAEQAWIEARQQGIELGYKNGHSEGYSEGREEGYDAGWNEAATHFDGDQP